MNEIEQVLKEYHPELFDRERPVPLKIGIRHDIVSKHGFRSGDVWYFLRRWTSCTLYLEALSKPGNMRYGLSGIPVDRVDKMARKLAHKRLQGRKNASAQRIHGRNVGERVRTPDAGCVAGEKNQPGTQAE